MGAEGIEPHPSPRTDDTKVGPSASNLGRNEGGKGRQNNFGVPASWEGRLREWIERDREVRKLLLEISKIYRD
jgi:hypothetical protein